jgi:hypothetical protein
MQLKSRSGQSVVEFIFVTIVFLNLLLVTFNAVMAFVVQQYMSYAVFMAARAYQASQEDPSAQDKAARDTLNSYLYFGNAPAGVFKFPGYKKILATDVEAVFPAVGSNLPQYGQTQPAETVKIEVRFKVPLFQLPVPGLTEDLIRVPLRAASYLGREPTREECKSFFQSFYNFYNKGGEDLSPAMDDTNC